MSVISSPAEASSITIRNPERLAFLTQTTLSTSDVRQTVIALRKRFPDIVGPDEGDICYATENRQQAVRRLCQIVDLLLVVGSASSSNSNRLCEVALAAGTPAHLLLDGSGLEAAWVDGKRCIGITAGASTPAHSVCDLLDALRRIAELEVSVMTGKQERVIFKPPPGLDLPHNC
jgi:4-hydroxy-3-methylbut-2-en-1-yl diphosphate reductase